MQERPASYSPLSFRQPVKMLKAKCRHSWTRARALWRVHSLISSGLTGISTCEPVRLFYFPKVKSWVIPSPPPLAPWPLSTFGLSKQMFLHCSPHPISEYYPLHLDLPSTSLPLFLSLHPPISTFCAHLFMPPLPSVFSLPLSICFLLVNAFSPLADISSQ